MDAAADDKLKKKKEGDSFFFLALDSEPVGSFALSPSRRHYRSSCPRTTQLFFFFFSVVCFCVRLR